MGDTASILNEAYQLIENGQAAEARNLLKPLLESDSSNPDVWWLYVHAAGDAAEGRRALNRLAELSPSYPGLPDLYQQVTGTPLRTAAKPLARPPAPATLPDLPGSTKPVPSGESFEEEFDDDIIEEKPARRLPWRILALVAIVLIVVIGLALLLSQPPAPVVTETPTDIAIVPTITVEALPTQEVIPTQEPAATQEVIVTEAMVPTEEASPTATEEAPVMTSEVIETVEAVETDEPVVATAQIASATEETLATEETSPVATEEAPTITDEPPVATGTTAPTEDVTPEVVATADSQAVLFQALAAFNVTEPEAITTVSTRLGNTLVVNACTIPGPAGSRALTDIMETLTAQIANIPPDVDALGVSINDCDAGTQGRTIAVPIGTVKAYSRKEIDVREFQRLWQPVS